MLSSLPATKAESVWLPIPDASLNQPHPLLADNTPALLRQQQQQLVLGPAQTAPLATHAAELHLLPPAACHTAEREPPTTAVDTNAWQLLIKQRASHSHQLLWLPQLPSCCCGCCAQALMGRGTPIIWACSQHSRNAGQQGQRRVTHAWQGRCTHLDCPFARCLPGAGSCAATSLQGSRTLVFTPRGPQPPHPTPHNQTTNPHQPTHTNQPPPHTPAPAGVR